MVRYKKEQSFETIWLCSSFSHLCRSIVEIRIELVNHRTILVDGGHSDSIGVVNDAVNRISTHRHPNQSKEIILIRRRRLFQGGSRFSARGLFRFLGRRRRRGLGLCHPIRLLSLRFHRYYWRRSDIGEKLKFKLPRTPSSQSKLKEDDEIMERGAQ